MLFGERVRERTCKDTEFACVSLLKGFPPSCSHVNFLFGDFHRFTTFDLAAEAVMSVCLSPAARVLTKYSLLALHLADH